MEESKLGMSETVLWKKHIGDECGLLEASHMFPAGTGGLYGSLCNNIMQIELDL